MSFQKMFHVKQKTLKNGRCVLQNLVGERRFFHKKLIVSGKTEKNREKLKKMLAFPCFLCYNH